LITTSFSIHASTLQSDRPTDGYWRCHSANDRDPIYFSAVWEQRVLATEVQAGFVEANKIGKVIMTGWKYPGK
jgi:hypothetical protein